MSAIIRTDPAFEIPPSTLRLPGGEAGLVF